MSRARLRLDRLPVSDTAAMLTADRAQGFVALNVGLSRTGMAFDVTVPNSKYTQGPPILRQSEQLQSVAISGVDGSVRRTAPQWQEP